MCTTSSNHHRMMTIIWVCIGIICATSVQAIDQLVNVEIEPQRQVVVRQGNSLDILCRVGTPITSCLVDIPGNVPLYLQPNQTSSNSIVYHGSGYQGGQCGVHIANVQESHNGTFKCSVVPKENRAASSASLDIIVAKAPRDLELVVSTGKNGSGKYEDGEQVLISCSALSGRPAANVSLYLDDELISNERRSTNYPNKNDNSIEVQNVSRTIVWTDNGKFIRCVANHIALDRPMEKKRQLEVIYPPRMQPTIDLFGYVIGQPGVVNVSVNANPRPTFTWYVDNKRIVEGHPDESNRLQSSTAVKTGNGTWTVILTIDSIQKSDTEKTYILEARNDLGTVNYSVMLSTSTEPAGVNLDAGSIIGIVVGVLVLILIVFLLIFARATGRWCFAGDSSFRNSGESNIADRGASVSLLRIHNSKADDTNGRRSDTESAGRYSRSEVDGAAPTRQRPKISFSQLFKRNKDKVSGADADTVRAINTVDDQKTSEPPAAGNISDAESGPLAVVYAELDLTPRPAVPHFVVNDTTEYAEILYAKPMKADK